MNLYKAVLAALFPLFIACQPERQEELNLEEILNKSIVAHDSLGRWDAVDIKLDIAEPRVSNPQRFSKVELNNSTGTFSLQRMRNGHLVSYTIDTAGNVINYLDGNTDYDSSQVAGFRLQKERTLLYKNFYQLLLGLPMSLNNQVDEFLSVEKAEFHGSENLKLSVKLKSEVISDYWNIFIDEQTHELIGVEIFFPDDNTKGERILMNGDLYIEEGLKIPRFRHWHHLNDNSYSGSDILL